MQKKTKEIKKRIFDIKVTATTTPVKANIPEIKAIIKNNTAHKNI